MVSGGNGDFGAPPNSDFCVVQPCHSFFFARTTLFSEEHGFLGSVFLLIIYVIVIYRIINIGSISRSYFAKLFCYGYGSAIFFYVTVNMSMVLGLLPIVGSPLPIMSYGGSSMLATMIGFAIVMSAKINHKQLIA